MSETNNSYKIYASKDYVDSKMPEVTTDDNGKLLGVVEGSVGLVTLDIPSTEGLASETYVTEQIAGLVNSAPETLDTLGELATALQSNQSVVDTLNSAITDKADKSSLGALASKSTVTKADLDSGVQASLNKADTALQSYTETDPTVPAWAKAESKPTYTKSEVGLGNVDNVKQYSASNPPPYPVTSVNDKTGAVTLAAADVGAEPTITTLSVAKGGTGYNTIVDTTYTTARYRASALVNAETDPTVNGVINWQYE